MQGQEQALQAGTAVQPRRHQDLEVVGYCKCAPIESQMMDTAAGQAVVDGVWTTKLAPANVGCLQAQI